uniref:Uncharacterized protein n=1 Tax=Tetradesmus obliquus TaxID=3088 RepID=A0A383W270_TETOB|eukprot:jgi/Sobl393_1/12224/SZX76139.1
MSGDSRSITAAAAAAARLAPAGLTSSSSATVSGAILGLLSRLQPEASMGLGEREMLPFLQDLEDQGLLPSLEVQLLSQTEASPADDHVTLQTQPKRFRQLLEAAILKSVLLTEPETKAKGTAINAVVQLLLTSTSGSSSALQLRGKPVSIDRIEVAGSVGKSVAVQGQWDVDLVAFVNLPETSDTIRSIDLFNPEVTHSSGWIKDLQQQLCCLLQQQLQTGSSSSSSSNSSLQVIEPPCIGRAAVTFTAAVLFDECEHQLSFDVLLAPNFATGAGAAAAAAAVAKLQAGGGSSSSGTSSSSSNSMAPHPPADVQRRAVLAPVLAVADIVAKAMLIATGPDWDFSEAEAACLNKHRVTQGELNVIEVDDAGSCDGLIPERIRADPRGFMVITAGQREALRRLKPSFMRNVWLSEAATQFVKQASVAAAADGLSGRVVTSTIRLVKAWGWTQAAAADAKIGRGRFSPAVRFGGLAGERFYSWQQASALQQFGMWDSSNSSSCSGQPLVVHPVDPTCSVFDQTDAPFELWAEFGRAYELLQQQLMSCSWGEIVRISERGCGLGLFSRA